MSKQHQGAMVKEWVDRNHGSVNQLAGDIAAQAPKKDRNKIFSSVVNLVGTSISKHEFLPPSWHKKWQDKIAQHTGYSLAEVLKEMGEDTDRSQGYLTTDHQKELFIWQGKYEAAMEMNSTMVRELKDLVISLKKD